YIEYLTDQLVQRAWMLIEEVESYGGMSKAIEAGIPKLRIEEAATRKQARIDSQSDILVGVNRYKVTEESDFDILEVDNTTVRKQQIEGIEKLKAGRNSEAVAKALDAITESAKTGEGNLLALAVDAARKRATLGEISFAMEKVFGRYTPEIRSVSGVYSKESMNNEVYEKAVSLIHTFASIEGRRPRIMVAKMGQDGHDRGAKIIATGFADIGFTVDIGPLFHMPEEVANQAIENDVDVVGISSLAAGHKTLIPQLIEALRKAGREDILVVAGGVIPRQDYEYLFQHGVVAVFGPGTPVTEAAVVIMEKLLE
ncbi:MAG TPA: methylmalonyl-CoA mutase family protein, partial [Leptospiraceae bacterium]|nr:methylmalonyl-CoA mutase family protein [Leptospiraceae bacterium]